MHWKELMDRDKFAAVLFDLDGVLTPTATVHAACWKRMFDEFLEGWSKDKGVPFEPFDIDSDYHSYVDGKPRYDGVRSFLEARNIPLPQGRPGDAPGHGSVCAMGNRKDHLVNEVLGSEGVEAFPGSVSLVQALRQAGFKTAVVSSSKNCQAVLQAADIEDLFDARVDGQVAVDRQLAGKPAPDMFWEAARELGVPPEQAVVVEDAIVGAQAGREGGFGLVIGIAHGEKAEELQAHGADLVVADLGELL